MQYDKLQLGCLLIVLYVAFIYVRERYAYKIKKKEPVFAWLLVMGILEITLDGITAYTVNHLDSVPAVVNMVLHMCFLCSLDIMMFLMFLYLLDITRGIPKNRKKRILLMAPLVINLAIVIIFMPQLSYLHGNITNYSMGISAYTCFIMVAVYILAAIVILCICINCCDLLSDVSSTGTDFMYCADTGNCGNLSEYGKSRVYKAAGLQ